jgi:hypothetical protein
LKGEPEGLAGHEAELWQEWPSITEDSKVGGSRTSSRAVRCPVGHDTWIQERGTREKEATKRF